MSEDPSGTRRPGRKSARSADHGDSEPGAAAKDEVIVIGGSGGGMEALGLFFDAKSPDSGCAFVVVLHLDPKRESEMAHVLSFRTAMTVVQIENGMRIAANRVYVIAPDTDVEVRDGGLHASKPTKQRGLRHPVD